MAVLQAKLPTPNAQRRVLLEGARISAAEALTLGIVDDLGGNGDEVVQKAIALAENLSGKASAKAWGLIKAGMHKQAIADLATDRGSDGSGPAVLAKL